MIPNYFWRDVLYRPVQIMGCEVDLAPPAEGGINFEPKYNRCQAYILFHFWYLKINIFLEKKGVTGKT